MGDSVPLDAHRGIAEADVVDRELTEVGSPLAHHNGNEIDGDRVKKSELQALPADGPGGHGNVTTAEWRKGVTSCFM